MWEAYFDGCLLMAVSCKPLSFRDAFGLLSVTTAYDGGKVRIQMCTLGFARVQADSNAVLYHICPESFD